MPDTSVSVPGRESISNWETPAWCPALPIAGTDARIPVLSLLPRPKPSSAESGWARGELSLQSMFLSRRTSLPRGNDYKQEEMVSNEKREI